MRLVVALSLAAMAFVLAGCQTPEEPASVPSTGHSADTVTLQPVLDLAVGDCLMDISTPIGSDLADVPLIDCDQPHESEVYAEVVLEGVGFPGVDEIVNTSIASCMAEFGAFVGVDHPSSTLDFAYYYPTPSSWAVGDRSIFCVVFDPGVLTEGTLEGSRR